VSFIIMTGKGQKQYASVEVLKGDFAAEEGDVIVGSGDKAFLTHKEASTV
jgi:hypothetical protein